MLPNPQHIDGFVYALKSTKQIIDYELDAYDVPLLIKCKSGKK